MCCCIPSCADCTELPVLCLLCCSKNSIYGDSIIVYANLAVFIIALCILAMGVSVASSTICLATLAFMACYIPTLICNCGGRSNRHTRAHKTDRRQQLHTLVNTLGTNKKPNIPKRIRVKITEWDGIPPGININQTELASIEAILEVLKKLYRATNKRDKTTHVIITDIVEYTDNTHVTKIYKQPRPDSVPGLRDWTMTDMSLRDDPANHRRAGENNYSKIPYQHLSPDEHMGVIRHNKKHNKPLNCRKAYIVRILAAIHASVSAAVPGSDINTYINTTQPHPFAKIANLELYAVNSMYKPHVKPINTKEIKKLCAGVIAFASCIKNTVLYPVTHTLIISYCTALVSKIDANLIATEYIIPDTTRFISTDISKCIACMSVGILYYQYKKLPNIKLPLMQHIQYSLMTIMWNLHTTNRLRCARVAIYDTSIVDPQPDNTPKIPPRMVIKPTDTRIDLDLKTFWLPESNTTKHDGEYAWFHTSKNGICININKNDAPVFSDFERICNILDYASTIPHNNVACFIVIATHFSNYIPSTYTGYLYYIYIMVQMYVSIVKICTCVRTIYDTDEIENIKKTAINSTNRICTNLKKLCKQMDTNMSIIEDMVEINPAVKTQTQYTNLYIILINLIKNLHPKQVRIMSNI